MSDGFIYEQQSQGKCDAKNQNQRKRRQERESCINNIKLNGNSGSKREHHQGRRGGANRHPSVDNTTYTRHPRQQYSTRGSLGNIEANYFLAGEPTGLRRSQSLAIEHHREEIFTSLQVPNQRERRPQLIPRARLIDRNSRYNFGGSCIENLDQSFDRSSNKRSSVKPCDYTDFPDNNPQGRDYIEPVYYSPIPNGNPVPKFIIDPVTNSESNSYEDLPALSLPNYYPDSKCDTASSVGSFEKKYFSCDNIPEHDSIPYDENIVLTSNRTLYEPIYAKPKTIRGPTSYTTSCTNNKFNSDNSDGRNFEEDAISLDCFETDTNLDEIKLNNDKIAKVVEEQEKLVEKTNIEVQAPPQVHNTYKTIVTVDGNNEQEENKHSHNYLREFLESQKGSKRPLQNFILKKFSNLTRKNSKELESNLIDNQFYSLPDITVTKNLQKCEKIDKKLRKYNKKNEENRFIVNIGRNFDVAGIPIDFELKIAKVPKRNNKINQEEFLQAVKDLKHTLNNNMETDSNREYHEKLDTMRTYWDNMANGTITNEKCKIVHEVRKKFEPTEEKPNRVHMTKQLFEKPRNFRLCHRKEEPDDNQFESLSANMVEIEPLNKAKNIEDPEFDHVRYRVVKSDLFQKKIFANCEKESQFDGLMQYLQDYSFQELLRDNNIVIIEPIRSKIPHEKPSTKIVKNVTPLLHKNRSQDSERNSLRKHFFYHPIRVNKEVNDDELPNPDTVKQVRQFFEKGGLKRSQSSQIIQQQQQCEHVQTVDPDKDHCSDESTSNPSDFGSQENLFDPPSKPEHCCDDQQFVSEDFLEKVRKCGTTITYYGGRIVKKQCGQSEFTSKIMEEIENNERDDKCNCQDYQGVKFRLVKSNSCNSRLELVGTNDLAKSKQIYNENRQRHLIGKLKEVKEYENNNTFNNNNELDDNQPRIIAEERKMTHWSDNMNNKTYASINITPVVKKINYNYHNFNSLNDKNRKNDDMEFEPYEVA